MKTTLPHMQLHGWAILKLFKSEAKRLLRISGGKGANKLKEKAYEHSPKVAFTKNKKAMRVEMHSCSVAHSGHRLMLLPSSPDMVHKPKLHGTLHCRPRMTY